MEVPDQRQPIPGPDRDALFANLLFTVGQALDAAADRGQTVGVVGVIKGVHEHELIPSGQSLERMSLDEQEEIVEGVHRLAVNGIRHTLDADDTSPLAAEPASEYYIEDRSTESADYGSIGRTVVRVPGESGASEELVTTTTISDVGHPETYDEQLHATLLTKGGVLHYVEGYVLPRVDQDYFSQCIDVFGHDSAATSLMNGLFADTDELSNRLLAIRNVTLEVGVYDQSYIDDLLGHVRRMAIEAKQNRELGAALLTAERIMRLTQYAMRVTNVG